MQGMLHPARGWYTRQPLQRAALRLVASGCIRHCRNTLRFTVSFLSSSREVCRFYEAEAGAPEARALRRPCAFRSGGEKRSLGAEWAVAVPRRQHPGGSDSLSLLSLQEDAEEEPERPAKRRRAASEPSEANGQAGGRRHKAAGAAALAPPTSRHDVLACLHACPELMVRRGTQEVLAGSRILLYRSPMKHRRRCRDLVDRPVTPLRNTQHRTAFCRRTTFGA